MDTAADEEQLLFATAEKPPIRNPAQSNAASTQSIQC
jgi:hypothetical protein